MTVAQFQKVNEINTTTPDTVERLGWIVCHIYGLTEAKVNAMEPKPFLKLLSKIEKQMTAKPYRWQRIKIQIDATKITLGQFIECQHWLKNDAIAALDLVAASLLLKRGNHKADAIKMKQRPFNQVLPKVQVFIESMNSMIGNYKGLFEVTEPVEGEEPEKLHPFIDRYGWIYSAKELAAYECITLEQAYTLPIIQAFNGLSYLKAKQSYDKAQAKK